MSKKKGKVLCVCQGGNSRSVGLAYILKYGYDTDAIAVGWEGNSEETVEMLCEWADIIIVMQEEFRSKILEKFHSKLTVCDVGHDRYFAGFHKDLTDQCYAFIEKEIAQTVE